MAKKNHAFFPTKEEWRKRMHLPYENTIFFALQLVFWVLQCVLFLICLQKALNPFFPLLFGAVLFLLSLKSRNKMCRVLIYTLTTIALLLITVMIIGFCLVAEDQTGVVSLALAWNERLGFAISYVITVMQPVLLMALPSYIVTARFAATKPSVTLLHLLAWAEVAFAAAMLYLKHYPGITGYLLNFSGLSVSFFSATVLLWVFLLTSAALAFAVYMLYPFGTARIKKAVKTARAKLPQNETND